MLFQRVSRDQHFSRPSFDVVNSEFGSCEVVLSPLSCSYSVLDCISRKKYGAIFGAGQISTIQSLVGQTGRRWVMGVISQLEDGHFYLEDLAASVEIDLSKAISFAFNALAIIFQT